MKKLIKIGLLLAVIGGIIGFVVYNKPHQDIQSAKADYQLKATELFANYEANEAESNKIFLDKIIEIEGKIADISKDKEAISITLDAGGMLGGVICKLDNLSNHKRTNFEVGESIKLKGKCTGMLMDVVLVRCVEL